MKNWQVDGGEDGRKNSARRTKILAAILIYLIKQELNYDISISETITKSCLFILKSIQ
jgi:hypothetical protein